MVTKQETGRGATEADKGVGVRIKLRRRLVGMSQSTLGESIGVSFRQVQKYESGINRIGVTRLEQIAQALDVPLSHFLASQPETTSAGPTLDKFLALPEAADLIGIFTQISDARIRRQIVDLIGSVSALSEPKLD